MLSMSLFKIVKALGISIFGIHALAVTSVVISLNPEHNKMSSTIKNKCKTLTLILMSLTNH